MKPDIIVVGAGPAGLMAAGRAAELGARVLLLERNDSAGKKLLLTGNGRCNLANTCDIPTFMERLEPPGAFLRNALARFYVDALRGFFTALGVPTVVDEEGRVYPASQRSAHVLAGLQRYLRGHGAQLQTGAEVRQLVRGDRGIAGVRLASGSLLPADAVILATGGLSYPGTGSTGTGLRLARELGHTVRHPRPGLVPLLTAEPFVTRLQGVAVPLAEGRLWRGAHPVAAARGELLFRHDGVTGPLILRLSLHIGDALHHGPLRLQLDLLPDLDEDELDAHLRRDLAGKGKSGSHALLKGLLPRALVDVVAERSGISPGLQLAQVTAAQRTVLGTSLKRFELTVRRTRPIAEAMVTVGGVALDEVDPRTMGSRLVPGLYLAGEVLDLAGETGGYNLQIAFTTGRVAGESAARRVTAEKELEPEDAAQT